LSMAGLMKQQNSLQAGILMIKMLLRLFSIQRGCLGLKMASMWLLGIRHMFLLEMLSLMETLKNILKKSTFLKLKEAKNQRQNNLAKSIFLPFL
jgi:hypothetical protein